MDEIVKGKFSILNKIMNEPYPGGAPKNRNNLTGHECKIKSIIVADGYKEIGVYDLLKTIGKGKVSKSKNFEQVYRKRLKKLYDKKQIDLTKNKGKFFIYQPFGTQSAPDFLLLNDKSYLPIEAKSNSKEAKILWNSGRPQRDIVYVFSYPKRNYYFLGQDYPGSKLSLVNKIRNTIERILNKLNNKYLLGDKDNLLGEYIYFRPMLSMKHGLDTLPITTIDKIEKNVKDFVENR